MRRLNEPTDKNLLTIWQEIVKLGANYICEYPNCRKSNNLNAHHIYSRGHKSTRYDPDNGMCLCAGHHSMANLAAHKDPEFKNIIIEAGVRTEQFYIILRRKAFTPANVDMRLEKLYLTKELNKLKGFI